MTAVVWPRPARPRAYIGLGSNLDSPVIRISEACRRLAGLTGSRLCVVSSLYRSRPLPVPGKALEQPDYVNAVACLETTLSPEALLAGLQAIEAALGRRRDGPRWGPRTLDLDILLYGDWRIATPTLTIPHPGLPERDFVLYPLAEIAAGITIPGLGPLDEVLERCPERGIRRIAPSPMNRLEAAELGST